MAGTNDMTVDEFRDFLNSWGANQDLWPVENAPAAANLLVRSVEAQALFKAAAALDALLEAVPQPELSDSLRNRVMALGPQDRKVSTIGTTSLTERMTAFFGALMRPAIAGAAVAGIAVGIGISTLGGLSGLEREAPQTVAVTAPISTASPTTVTAEASETENSQTLFADSLGGGYTPNLAVFSETVSDDRQDSGFQQANFALY